MKEVLKTIEFLDELIRINNLKKPKEYEEFFKEILGRLPEVLKKVRRINNLKKPENNK